MLHSNVIFVNVTLEYDTLNLLSFTAQLLIWVIAYNKILTFKD